MRWPRRCSSTSPLIVISGLASRPFSQGWGGVMLQAASAAPIRITGIVRAVTWVSSCVDSWQRCRDAALELRTLFVAKARVHVQHLAVGPDEHRGGHALHAEALRAVARGVERDREGGGQLGEEALGVVSLAVEVDADHLQAACAVLRLHLVHPGERLPAGAAPRGPEVDVGELALE